MNISSILTLILCVGSLVACGGKSSSNGVGGSTTTDPYANVPSQQLADAMLKDLTITPPPPMGNTCAPQDSHCAHIYVFNKSGQLIAEQYRSNDPIPSITETQFNTYDANNRLAQKDYVWGATYTPQISEQYQYDAQGKLTRKLSTYPSGEKYDTVYVNSGNQATATTTHTTSAGVSSIYWTATITYDTAGNTVQLISTSTIGGSSTTSYSYDANNRLTDLNDISSMGTYREHYTYNLEGNLIRKEIDFANADGIVDQVRMYAYNTYDFNNDGVIDINIGYIVAGAIDSAAIGTSDGIYQTNSYNTSGSLNWNGLSTGTCSTCGDMQGQINKILLGF